MSRYVIDRTKLGENIELIKEKAGVPVIGVVKGNGYGFGIKEFTLALKEHGIKTFAVTEVTDIPVLKEILDGEDILVMRSTCVESEAETIAKNGCIATIGSTEAARVMNEVSEKLGVKTRCHLKIDTGMGRYGFMPGEVGEAIKCYALPNLEFTGIYTHFSSAFRNKALTASQLEVFKDAAEQIKKEVGETGIMHCANSPALLNSTGVTLDAVRIGSAFTGRVITDSKTGLHRLGSLEAEVVDVKTVPAGYAVGYNGTYTTKRETKIAIVPFGHYDGFGLAKEKEQYDLRYILGIIKRFLNKKRMYVRINGELHYVIGGIGLSHTAIDITGTDIKPGDTASVDISPLMVNPRIEREYK
ncbi:MAG: alanine racemase [Eubacterium sp.]|nr:alanine racemase [Eubacterium sp.]